MQLTKCTGDNCPLKHSCKRYSTQIPNYNISEWYAKPPIKNLGGVLSCKMFWGDKDDKNKSILKQLQQILN